MESTYRVFSDAGVSIGQCAVYAGVIVKGNQVWCKFRGVDRIDDSNVAELFGIVTGLILTPKKAKVILYTDNLFSLNTLGKICRKKLKRKKSDLVTLGVNLVNKIVYQSVEDRSVEIFRFPRNSLPYMHWAHLICNETKRNNSSHKYWNQILEGDYYASTYLKHIKWQDFANVPVLLSMHESKFATFRSENNDGLLKSFSDGNGSLLKYLARFPGNYMNFRRNRNGLVFDGDEDLLIKMRNQKKKHIKSMTKFHFESEADIKKYIRVQSKMNDYWLSDDED